MRKYFAERIPAIDRKIKELFPKEIDAAWLQGNGIRIADTVDTEVLANSLGEPFHHILDTGGKRIRPMLSCLTHDALGGRSPEIYTMAAMSEILHIATLMIDDIQDNSAERRGVQAVHMKYGTDVTINCANFAYFLPLQIIRNVDISTQNRMKLSDLLAETMVSGHLGQGMDLGWNKAKQYESSIEEYLQMCAFKTGIGMNFAIGVGGILAEASDEQLEQLYFVGNTVGVSLQILDDILDLYPIRHLGEPHGEDIRDGKLTYMVVHSLASGRRREELLDILREKASGPEDIERAIEIMEENNSVTAAKEHATTTLSLAKMIVAGVLPDTQYRPVYIEMLDYLGGLVSHNQDAGEQAASPTRAV